MTKPTGIIQKPTTGRKPTSPNATKATPMTTRSSRLLGNRIVRPQCLTLGMNNLSKRLRFRPCPVPDR